MRVCVEGGVVILHTAGVQYTAPAYFVQAVILDTNVEAMRYPAIPFLQVTHTHHTNYMTYMYHLASVVIA